MRASRRRSNSRESRESRTEAVSRKLGRHPTVAGLTRGLSPESQIRLQSWADSLQPDAGTLLPPDVTHRPAHMAGPHHHPHHWRIRLAFLRGIHARSVCGTGRIVQSPGLVGALAILRVAVAALRCLIALQIKRLHGRGKSAGWMLRYLVPFIGGWVMLTSLGFMRGAQGPNRYGAKPN